MLRLIIVFVFVPKVPVVPLVVSFRLLVFKELFSQKLQTPVLPCVNLRQVLEEVVLEVLGIPCLRKPLLVALEDLLD